MPEGLKTILIDFDGVLTDGKQYPDHLGKNMFFATHSRDNRAIRELINNGYYVVIVTANDSDNIKAFARKVGADHWHTRDKSNLPFQDYIAIGDDVWDIPMLKKASQSFCPLDADLEVKQVDKINILSVRGGEGVIAELVRKLL